VKDVVFWRKSRQRLEWLHRFARRFALANRQDWLKARFCWRKIRQIKICFARFAAQTLLASNFCLARQKSPKSRLKERGYCAGITMGQA